MRLNNLLKKCLIGAITGASLTCMTTTVAEQVPIVRRDATDCTLRPWHQLGGCFQNGTSERIHGNQVFYRQSIYYNDKRTKIVAVIPMEHIQANHYVVVSTSPDVLTNHHITNVTNELVTTRATDGNTIPGCIFNITSETPVVSIKLVKSGKQLTCV